MFTTILSEVTEAKTPTYCLIGLNVLPCDREFNDWLDELEEKAAYHDLVLRYGGNEAFGVDGF